MLGKGLDAVIRHACHDLSRILKVDAESLEKDLEAAHFHDWQSDPYSGGAYSYVRVGGEDAIRALAEPVAGSLFFAGEATDDSGVSGTVEGAIASGKRAAQEAVLAAGGQFRCQAA